MSLSSLLLFMWFIRVGL